MAYTWTTGETITAENLNKTGQTLVLEGEIETQEGYGLKLPITASELLDIIDSGTMVLVSIPDSGSSYTSYKRLELITHVSHYAESDYASYSFYTYDNTFSASNGDDQPFVNWE